MKQKKAQEISATPGSSATVVDGKLILTFPDAMTPIVWQMDLDQAKSAALEVLEDKKKKAFSLMLRNAKNESIEIAPFEERDQAVKALMMTSQALQEGHGKIRPQAVTQMPYQNMQGASAQTANQKNNANSNKVGGFLAIGLILILMLIWVLSIPRQGEMFANEQTAADGSSSSANAAQSGVPVSADDFLSGNK